MLLTVNQVLGLLGHSEYFHPLLWQWH